MKTILITGASDGLGKQLAIELSKKENLNLILFGRDMNKLKKTRSELNQNNNIDLYAFDLGNIVQVNEIMDNIMQQYEYIDYLFNNAGLNTEKATINNLKINDLSYMMNVNCIAPTLIIQKVLPAMRKHQFGFIINILSTVCLHEIPDFCGYTATKNAFKSINDTTRKAVKNDNINVFAVYPGGMDSNFRSEDRPYYLQPIEVAKIIIKNIEITYPCLMQEIVIRPIIENNY